MLTFLLSLAETSGLCDQSTCKLMFDYTKVTNEHESPFPYKLVVTFCVNLRSFTRSA